MIILYTSKTCKYCPEVKEFMGKNSIIFEEKDIGEAVNRELLISKGGRGVPSIIDTIKSKLVTGKDEIIEYLNDNEVWNIILK